MTFLSFLGGLLCKASFGNSSGVQNSFIHWRFAVLSLSALTIRGMWKRSLRLRREAELRHQTLADVEALQPGIPRVCWTRRRFRKPEKASEPSWNTKASVGSFGSCHLEKSEIHVSAIDERAFPRVSVCVSIHLRGFFCVLFCQYVRSCRKFDTDCLLLGLFNSKGRLRNV